MHAENTLVIENKIDLENSSAHETFLSEFKHCRLSLKSRDGLQAFRAVWQAAIDAGLTQPIATDGVVVNARHAAALSESVAALELAAQKMRDSELSELVAADLRDAIESIGKVVGKVDNERMLDSLFKQFCIGK